MTEDNAIGYIIGYGIAFLIGIFLTRAIFSIPKFLRIQQAQVQILTEIAIQQGVKSEILEIIHGHNELTTRNKTVEEFKIEVSKNPNATDLEKEALSYRRE